MSASDVTRRFRHSISHREVKLGIRIRECLKRPRSYMVIPILLLVASATTPSFAANKKALEQLASTGACIRCDLRQANLRGRNLTGADLTGAYLIGANLAGVTLRKAKLDGARLTGANLRAADLSHASLVGAYLIDADLARAKLQRADLRRARLARGNLHGADLTGANLARSRLQAADLRQTVGLSDERLRNACGDSRTQLSGDLQLSFCRTPGRDIGK